jgi:hypothetical protein
VNELTTWLIYSAVALLLYVGMLAFIAILSGGLLFGLYLWFEVLLTKFLSASSLTSWTTTWRSWISGQKDVNRVAGHKS